MPADMALCAESANVPTPNFSSKLPAPCRAGYGVLFRRSQNLFEPVPPTTVEGIERYLQNRLNTSCTGNPLSFSSLSV
jgi:hypothetical protein